MDITELKGEVEKVIQAMEAELYRFDFAGLIPAYPGVEDTSYVLQVSADWLDGVGCTESTDYIISKLYEYLDAEYLRYINRIDVYDPDGYLHCLSEDLVLRNEIDFKPGKLAAFEI